MYTLIIRYELRREKLDIALGFIRFTLAENISFGRDLLHLKVDLSSFLYTYIYIMSLRQVFAEIHLVLFMCL